MERDITDDPYSYILVSGYRQGHAREDTHMDEEDLDDIRAMTLPPNVGDSLRVQIARGQPNKTLRKYGENVCYNSGSPPSNSDDEFRSGSTSTPDFDSVSGGSLHLFKTVGRFSAGTAAVKLEKETLVGLRLHIDEDAVHAKVELDFRS